MFALLAESAVKIDMLKGGEIIALVAILGGVIFLVSATIAESWRKVRHSEIEAALKQDMLNRGMSAADIEQVIKASGKKLSKKCDTHA